MLFNIKAQRFFLKITSQLVESTYHLKRYASETLNLILGISCACVIHLCRALIFIFYKIAARMNLILLDTMSGNKQLGSTSAATDLLRRDQEKKRKEKQLDVDIGSDEERQLEKVKRNRLRQTIREEAEPEAMEVSESEEHPLLSTEDGRILNEQAEFDESQAREDDDRVGFYSILGHDWTEPDHMHDCNDLAPVMAAFPNDYMCINSCNYCEGCRRESNKLGYTPYRPHLLYLLYAQ